MYMIYIYICTTCLIKLCPDFTRSYIFYFKNALFDRTNFIDQGSFAFDKLSANTIDGIAALSLSQTTSTGLVTNWDLST